jgi:hypothetical protein
MCIKRLQFPKSLCEHYSSAAASLAAEVKKAATTKSSYGQVKYHSAAF